MRSAWAYARWLWSVVVWGTESAGYWIRPYDMLADARRWRWEPRQCCLCGRRHLRRWRNA